VEIFLLSLRFSNLCGVPSFPASRSIAVRVNFFGNGNLREGKDAERKTLSGTAAFGVKI
jgi:hypothetical protein